MRILHLTIFANEVQPLRDFLASINTDLINLMGALQEIIGELDLITVRHEHRNQSFGKQGQTWLSELAAKKKLKT
ncbi:hypothetical protein GL2_35890 [Microbulbifer sp. GL-2]|nr:hypothetical protein GL2_35890 [Microbulbifer sp. GL-2]